MKNNRMILTLLGGALLTAASCKKDDAAVTATTGTATTVTAAVVGSDTYRYTLPAGASSYTVLTPSAAAATVAVDAGTFTYTPAAGFNGSDAVSVLATTNATASGGCRNGNGSNRHSTVRDTVNFRIQVTAAGS